MAAMERKTVSVVIICLCACVLMLPCTIVRDVVVPERMMIDDNNI